ncbi:MBL fold metallo-hydrolase [Haloquadratum walsbyi]|uniref:Metal-dependent hydrolase domain protein n=1 Tax=Haloquadratum walsbyi (strain DSM 16790 / HBSQ001) TaxID=362976 RepID=Q18GX6_HALWD|nr:MBL fold metallo-hydrolase [Haloquadratum walsbyi]CAJ52769.1 metal-dependent hydrolase domain protein [Haloquadratum walsbyi DSM 16790]
MTVRIESLSISWLGYATVRIESVDGFVTYIDPGRYGVLDNYYAHDGDLVVVTHNHHYDSDAINQVADETATIVAFEGIRTEQIDRDVTAVSNLSYDTIRIDAESHCVVGPVDIWSLPAYNDPDGPTADADGSVVHPRGLGCGYRLSINNLSIFWPGDSDVLTGFQRLPVDVFLANIGGSVVMNRHAAASLTAALDPQLTIPIHYNTIDLLSTDADAFVIDVAQQNCPVVIEDPNERPA